MKIITFNANGIRSAARKGFFSWLSTQKADIVCIQETKAQTIDLDALFFPAGYVCEYVDAEKKGYSGVAIYAKYRPNAVLKQLGFDLSDQEGRYLQFDYPSLSVLSLYFPSGSSGETRQVAKYAFLAEFEKQIHVLQATGRDYILCGDFNIAHRAIDLKNWRANQAHSGFLPEERAWMDQLLGPMGHCDAFRLVNQQAEEYTWWSNRGQAWAKNVGWRIDYQVISQGLQSAVKNATIYRDTRFSDHAPLVIDYDLSLE
jgi:exodeoxyribonuclease-3